MIDIIMACFNEPSYLKRMLASIKQHILDLKEIKLYIIDDCSGYYEDYVKLLQDFNHIILKTEENSGPAISRNLGLKAALSDDNENDFITFFDDDDVLCDNILKYCDIEYDIVATFFDKDYITKTIDDFINPMYGLILSKEFIKKYDLKFPEIKYGTEDSLLRTLCFLKATKIKHVNSMFYDHIKREDSNFGKKYFKVLQKNKKNVNFLNSLDISSFITWMVNLNLYLENYENIDNNCFIKFCNSLIITEILQNNNISICLKKDYLFFLLYLIKKYINFNLLTKSQFKECSKFLILLFNYANTLIEIKEDYFIVDKLKSNVELDEEFNLSDIFDNIIPEIKTLKYYNITYGYFYYEYFGKMKKETII